MLMMSRQISRHPAQWAPLYDSCDRPSGGIPHGGAPRITGPLPVPGLVFAGMDPSSPVTYTRPWNPRPGMIAYLNFDGAAAQQRTPTGGVQRGRQQRRRGYR